MIQETLHGLSGCSDEGRTAVSGARGRAGRQPLALACLCGAIALLPLSGCGALGRLVALEYRFVDTLSAPAPQPSPPSSAEEALVAVINTETLEPDVRYLASPELAGRARGTPGNAAARAHIVSRLRQAGLTPLFQGSFEQPTFPEGEGTQPYATNIGAYLPAADAGAGWIVLAAHYDHLGIRGGEIHPGADDNASGVALLLALADALGRARPQVRRHMALVFPDAEEQPDSRTERMGSTWFWRHPPFPIAKLHCALVFDLLAGPPTSAAREAGLDTLVFVLGAEASPGLARLAQVAPPEPGLEPMLIGLPMIEAVPYLPWHRLAHSDYHGLREHGHRPFLFVTGGRASTYHTPEDTPDTLDYAKLARITRWAARLMVRTAEGTEELGWADLVADPRADARSLQRLYPAAGDTSLFPWLLRGAFSSDRDRVAELLHAWDAGAEPDLLEFRDLQLAALRLQAVLAFRPRWWFALW